MRRAMERNGSPMPILETDEQCTYFLTTLPVHPIFEGDQVSDQVRRQKEDAVDDRVFEVVQLAIAPKSSAELLEELGLSAHTKNYKKYIAPALDRGWIERTVPDKPRSRNQKYRVTALGRAVLDYQVMGEIRSIPLHLVFSYKYAYFYIVRKNQNT